MGYLAYLLTGRFYFMEQVQLAATLTAYLKASDNSRQGSRGILWTTDGAYITRGVAWSLRTLSQALAVTPDDDQPLRTEFITAIEENINRYHAVYVAQPNNPQGFCDHYDDYTSGDNKFMASPWMEDFLTAAWGYSIELAPPVSAAAQSRLQAFFAWKSRAIVGRLGQQGVSGEYNYRDAAEYNVAVAPSDQPNWSTGAGPWYANWGAAYQATVGGANIPNLATTLRGAYFPDATSYWGNLQPAIAYAVDLGAPGAVAAYQRMTSASNWGEIMARWGDNPVWSVRPRSM